MSLSSVFMNPVEAGRCEYCGKLNGDRYLFDSLRCCSDCINRQLEHRAKCREAALAASQTQLKHQDQQRAGSLTKRILKWIFG